MRRVVSVFLILLFLGIHITSTAEETPFTFDVSLENRLAMIEPSYFELLGTLTLSAPVDRIICSISNDRRHFEEYNSVYVPEKDALSVSLSSVVKKNAFIRLSPGEKTLKIICERENLSETVLEIRFTVLGDVGAYSEITKKCDFISRQNLSYLKTGQYYREHTSWRPNDKENTLSVHLPSDENAKLIQLEWLVPPASFKFEVIDTDGNTDVLHSGTNINRFYSDVFYLPEDTKTVSITVDDYDSGLCALRVFSEEDKDIQHWQPMPEKLDILHISAHQDDELLFFGGSIPYHAASGYKTGVLYMANCSRKRYAEALSGLWIAGVKYHPVFLGLTDGNVGRYEHALSLWNGFDHTVRLLTEEIRRLKPDVIITHGEDGEYGHKQHIVTSNTVLAAVKAAADPSCYPESFEKYGAWEVKKLYRHQTFGENVIKMDWNKPLDYFDGRTSLEMSEIAYNRHVSQISTIRYIFGIEYASDTFSLVHSTVGPDVIGGNFFENIE